MAAINFYIHIGCIDGSRDIIHLTYAIVANR